VAATAKIQVGGPRGWVTGNWFLMAAAPTVFNDAATVFMSVISPFAPTLLHDRLTSAWMRRTVQRYGDKSH